MDNPLLTKEWALCFQGKLKAIIKSRKEIFPVQKIIYEDNKIIWYKVNWFCYRKDEKRRWWGSLEDIEIIFCNTGENETHKKKNPWYFIIKN